MNNPVKRFPALLLLVSVLTVLLFTSCLEQETKLTDITSDESQTEAAETDEAEYRNSIPDDLPDADFDGYEFRILTRSNSMAYCAHTEDLYVEALNGDVINDAVYERNIKVEDRFNFRIRPVVIDAADESKPTAALKKSVLSGGDDYDMMIDHMIYMGIAATAGVFYNWYDIPCIDFDKPWWIRDANEKLTIGGKSFYALSDLSFNTIDYTCCIFFNRNLLEDYNIEIPYSAVNADKWTIDYLMSVTKDIYTDINNDGKRDEDDLYGYVSNAYSATVTYLWAFDNPVTATGGDGYPKLVINNEKTQAIVEKMYEYYYNDQGSYVINTGSSPKGTSWIDVAANSFDNGNAVFATGMFVNAKMQFRDLEDNYGILPYPMWDENQDGYYTMLDGHGPMMGVPATVSDTERNGIIIEAMSAEGYKLVTPAYYEVALKTKYTRDSESAQMVDIVMAGRTFDFGYMYDGWNGMAFSLQTMMVDKNTDFASFYAKNEAKVTKYYDKVIQAYNDYSVD